MIQLPALIDSTLAFFMAVHRFSAQRASNRCLILMAGVRNDAGNSRFRDIVKSCHIGSGIAETSPGLIDTFHEDQQVLASE